MFLSQDSGLSNSLSDQNITLLVPSSAAVAKMSSEDRSFWTLKGNVASLVRFHLVFVWILELFIVEPTKSEKVLKLNAV